VDVVLEKRQVQRAYEFYAPIYDFVFDWIFAPGRVAAIKHLQIQPTDVVLEVGIGTGLNMPLYPPAVRLVGIDLSQEMLDKAVERVQNLAMPNVTLKVMDATALDFGDNEFDKVVATYTISAVPDPVAVLREMRRVVKPGGHVIMVNDNVRYQGEEVPVDLILSDFAESAGLVVEKIWVLPRGKGNSSQQMGRWGRQELRKCVYLWRRP